MAFVLGHSCRQMASRGKYGKLYKRLCSLETPEWRTTFSEIESVIGFELPPSARLHRPWWSNRIGYNSNGHGHALAWNAAGWETAEVDMESETLLLRRMSSATVRRLFDEAWPPISIGAWPEGLSLRREDMYDERM